MLSYIYRIISIVVVIYALVLGVAVSAYGAKENNKEINVLQIGSDGEVVVAVLNPEESTSCSWSVLSVGNISSEIVRAKYSMLLAAKVSSKKVRISFSNCIVDTVSLP